MQYLQLFRTTHNECHYVTGSTVGNSGNIQRKGGSAVSKTLIWFHSIIFYLVRDIQCFTVTNAIDAGVNVMVTIMFLVAVCS